MGNTLTAYLNFCRQHTLCLMIALVFAGLFGNYFNYPIFLNINFLFGSIFAMLALQIFGLRRGITAAVLISSYSYLLWNHPYAIIIMTLEIAAVGCLVKNRRVGFVLADTLYWLFIGMPLIYLFYHIIMHVPISTVNITMVKQAINGIANALVARLVYTGFVLYSRTSQISYRDIIYNLLVAFVMFPALIMLQVDSQEDFNNADLQIRNALINDSQKAAQTMETWLANRRLPVVNLAEMATTKTAQQIQPHLEQLKKSDTNFLRAGLHNADAVTIAYFPLRDEEGQNNIGKNFADRPFIPLLKQTLQPMFSEVVMGKIAPRKPIVGMLAPVIRDGKFAGYVIGVLNMGQIKELLNNFSARNSTLYTLLDKNGKVIMTNRDDQAIMSPFKRNNGTLSSLDDGLKQWIPTIPDNTPISERWKNSFYVSEQQVGGKAEWRLILEQPVAPFQRMLYDNYTNKLTILFMITLASLILAELLSRKSFITLETLHRTTSDLPNKIATQTNIQWPESGVIEIRQLIENFQEMGSNIQNHVIELDCLNRSLQERIEERTGQLNNAMNELTIILENAPIGMSKIVDRKQVWVNNRICEMLKYTKEELWQKDIKKFYHSTEAYDRMTAEAYPQLAEGAVYETVLELVRKDGISIHVRCVGKTLDTADLSKGTLWLLEDITDIKEKEELENELRMEKLRLSTIEKEQRHFKEKEMLIKDLHDGIGGIITNISLLAQYGNLDRSGHDHCAIMQQIADLAIEGTTEVRSFMNSMEESEATWNNLLAEIRVHCGNMLAPHGTSFNFTTKIAANADSPGILRYVNIIRIFRELIANIVKHSRATAVAVIFNVDHERFVLEVNDNGTGFDSDTIKRRGLGHISSRSQAMGTSFSIITDNGTCARLELDYQQLNP